MSDFPIEGNPFEDEVYDNYIPNPMRPKNCNKDQPSIFDFFTRLPPNTRWVYTDGPCNKHDSRIRCLFI